MITMISDSSGLTVQTDDNPLVAYKNWRTISASHIAFPMADKHLGYVRIEYATKDYGDNGDSEAPVWRTLMSPAGQFVDCPNKDRCSTFECPDSSEKGCEMNVYYTNGYIILTTKPHGVGIELDSLDPFNAPDGPNGHRLLFLPKKQIQAIDNSVPVYCDMAPCRISISILP